ncbi:MAG: hypothetical protein HGA80_06790, partial [Candidatus Omnitrophica bacterium]|nr:hypothetical protein [Candidatus Omnitrophota bacterium]
IASASLPVFSSQALAEDKTEFKRTVMFALENVIFLMLPVAVFCILLSGPVVRVLFQRGIFDEYSTAQTATFLLFSALGLVFFGMARILAAAFHSLKDTRTPVKVALACLLVNALLNVTLMFPLKLAGIALASSLASAVNVTSLYRLLKARVGSFPSGLGDFTKKALLAALVQALVTWGVWQGLGRVPEFLRLVLVCGLGGAAYLACAAAVGLEQARKLASVIMKLRK